MTAYDHVTCEEHLFLNIIDQDLRQMVTWLLLFFIPAVTLFRFKSPTLVFYFYTA